MINKRCLYIAMIFIQMIIITNQYNIEEIQNETLYLNQTALTLKNEKQNPKLIFQTSQLNKFEMEYFSDIDAFQFYGGSDLLVQITDNNFIIDVPQVKVENLVLTSNVYFGDILQRYNLVLNEIFDGQIAEGWSSNDVSTCGAIKMLGGYGKFSGGEVRKTYNQLPQHNKLRITASYHFIDAWSGESGFMRANIGASKKMEFLWVEKYDHTKVENGINVCGGNQPEGKLSSLIDIEFPHNDDSISIAFGSNLKEDPFKASFGVSNIQIYAI